MTVDPKAGGAGEIQVEPKPSVEPETKKTEPSETPEQRIARLEAENEAFRKTQPQWQREVEEARRIKAEAESRATPSPTTRDPMDENIDAALAELQSYPTPANRLAYDVAVANKQRAESDRAVREAEKDFVQMPEAIRQRARDIWWNSRGTVPPSQARVWAEKEQATDPAETARLKKELDETKKDLEASKRGVFTTGGAPVLEPKSARTLADGSLVYTLAEWKKIESLPRAEQARLHKLHSAGKIVVEH